MTAAFVVGQRLEAVDRKNEALICPATVAEVTSTEVRIHFDGWNPDSYDYWCDRNSRDIFPVGWCKKNDHPLQPLGDELQCWFRLDLCIYEQFIVSEVIILGIDFDFVITTQV